MSSTCACGASVDLPSSETLTHCPHCGRAHEPRLVRVRVAVFLGVGSILALGGLLWLLQRLFGDGRGFWIGLVTMLVACAIGVPAIVMGTISLKRLRRKPLAQSGGQRAYAAIGCGIMTIGAALVVVTIVFPPVQYTLDPMHG